MSPDDVLTGGERHDAGEASTSHRNAQVHRTAFDFDGHATGRRTTAHTPFERPNLTANLVEVHVADRREEPMARRVTAAAGNHRERERRNQPHTTHLGAPRSGTNPGGTPFACFPVECSAGSPCSLSHSSPADACRKAMQRRAHPFSPRSAAPQLARERFGCPFPRSPHPSQTCPRRATSSRGGIATVMAC